MKRPSDKPVPRIEFRWKKSLPNRATRILDHGESHLDTQRFKEIGSSNKLPMFQLSLINITISSHVDHPESVNPYSLTYYDHKLKIADIKYLIDTLSSRFKQRRRC